ncbi:UNKNOWN [Stylonychia lemnae]|uniref:Uncharacterized protein n=1 Tax=Stylonychia lemnae TaxID=5949 RepID=A0A078ALC4_STYLE|nr:UNKNOWN [Stylonychia lemnae]|eukprot:CDW82676.1 UNKNOWN [Stylonychia lemnae]
MKSLIIAGAALFSAVSGVKVDNALPEKQLSQVEQGYGLMGGFGGHFYGHGDKGYSKPSPPHHHDRVTYDYTCDAKHDEACLYNDITLYGPKVVLVNLDSRCQINRLEREGIFVQTGDLIFVTGRADTCAWQEWDEPHKGPLDYDILFPGLDYDMPLKSEPGSMQEVVILEALSTGMTTYEINLYWGHKEVRHVSIDVYVNEQPALAVATPRFSC